MQLLTLTFSCTFLLHSAISPFYSPRLGNKGYEFKYDDFCTKIRSIINVITILITNYSSPVDIWYGIASQLFSQNTFSSLRFTSSISLRKVQVHDGSLRILSSPGPPRRVSFLFLCRPLLPNSSVLLLHFHTRTYTSWSLENQRLSLPHLTNFLHPPSSFTSLSGKTRRCSTGTNLLPNLIVGSFNPRDRTQHSFLRPFASPYSISVNAFCFGFKTFTLNIHLLN